MSGRPLVLASASSHRARLARDAGLDVIVIPPVIDERALDGEFDPRDPSSHAVRLAEAKARSVSPPPGSVVLGADQLAVVGIGAEACLLSKPASIRDAVEQLLGLSGTTHRLVNGLAALDTLTGSVVTAADEHAVTMRSFDLAAAQDYVARFAPLDAVGAYRIEDDAGLIERVEGSGVDGVIGLPVEIVRGLLEVVMA